MRFLDIPRGGFGANIAPVAGLLFPASEETDMNSTWQTVTLALLLLAAASGAARSADQSFLSDYSGLKPSSDNSFDQLYISDEAGARAAHYTAVMVDQPELFVHTDSEYKGMKPDEMKAIADSLREAITDELKDSYQIVDAPGPNVLYVRFAVADLMLDKKRRPILAYLPAGAVIYAAKNLMSDATSKVRLANMRIEGEVLDSQSLQQLAAMTASRGSLSGKASDQEPAWDEMSGLFSLVGKRLRCRLDNSQTTADKQTNCGDITPAPAG
jgi:hypothetical protein